MPDLSLTVAAEYHVTVISHNTVRVPTFRHWRLVFEDREVTLPPQHYAGQKQIRFDLGGFEAHQTIDLDHVVQIVANTSKAENGDIILTLQAFGILPGIGAVPITQVQYDITQALQNAVKGKSIVLWAPSVSSHGISGNLKVSIYA